MGNKNAVGEGIKQNNSKMQHLAHGTFSVTADLLGIKEE